MKLPQNLRSVDSVTAKVMIIDKLRGSVPQESRDLIENFVSRCEEELPSNDLRLVPSSIWNALARKSITATNISHIAAFVDLNQLSITSFGDFLENRSVPVHLQNLFYVLLIGWNEDDGYDMRASVVSYNIYLECRTTLNGDTYYDKSAIDKQKENVPIHPW